MTEADALNPWMRFEIRLIGLTLSMLAMALASALLNLSITSTLSGAVTLLLFGSVLLNCAVFVIWPEQSLTSTLRGRLPEDLGQRRLWLLLIRLLGFASVVLLVVFLIRIPH